MWTGSFSKILYTSQRKHWVFHCLKLWKVGWSQINTTLIGNRKPQWTSGLYIVQLSCLLQPFRTMLVQNDPSPLLIHSTCAMHWLGWHLAVLNTRLINAVMFAFAYPCIKPQEIFINCQRTGLILENILTITKSYLLPCSSRHCGQLLSSWISIWSHKYYLWAD